MTLKATARATRCTPLSLSVVRTRPSAEPFSLVRLAWVVVYVKLSREITMFYDHTNFQNIDHQGDKNDRSDVGSASRRHVDHPCGFSRKGIALTSTNPRPIICSSEDQMISMQPFATLVSICHGEDG